jgi:hypothetical protein
LYEHNWKDGMWCHRENDVGCNGGPVLDIEALLNASHPTPCATGFTESQIQAEQADYITAARRMALELRARWEKEQPVWNPPSGDDEIDELVWFKYVHANM